jgi:hypothetical protein
MNRNLIILTMKLKQNFVFTDIDHPAELACSMKPLILNFI